MRWKVPLLDSLFARLLAALLGVLAVTFVIVLVLILRERHEFTLLESGARITAQNIAETTEYLETLPADRRVQAWTSMQKHVENSELPPFAPGESPDRVFSQEIQRRLALRRQEEEAAQKVFVAQVQKRLGSRYRVSAGPPSWLLGANVIDLRQGPRRAFEPPPAMGEGAGPQLFLSRTFDVHIGLPDSTELTFRTSAPRHGPPLPREIFVNLGVLALALCVALYIMARTITRPLADLERAADAVGRGAGYTRLEEKGARELRGAARAFNAMQDRIRRYLDSRTRVLAAMSHDLRTPLTRLRLRVETIEDDALRSQCVVDIDEMSKMVSGALSVFRGLNDEEALESVDVNALLAALQQEFTHMGTEVTLTGRAQDALRAKPLALKRCLANLLHNAVQYGKRAHIVVEDGTALTIRVQDEGPGIAPELLEQVFEPFFRIEGSRNRDLGGTGLGLSIARDIAQAHGGSLTLHNLPHGLEALLVLPRFA